MAIRSKKKVYTTTNRSKGKWYEPRGDLSTKEPNGKIYEITRDPCVELQVSTWLQRPEKIGKRGF